MDTNTLFVDPASANDTSDYVFCELPMPINPFIVNGENIFQKLQLAIYEGTHSVDFPVGTILPDVWTHLKTGRRYFMPHILVDYRMVDLPEGVTVLGAVLLRQNATPVEIIFSEKDNNFEGSIAEFWLNSGEYFQGCSDGLREAATEIILEQGQIWQKITPRVKTRFFLPTLENLFCAFGFLGEKKEEILARNLAWAYFKNAHTNVYRPCAQRIFYDPNGNPRRYWVNSVLDNRTRFYGAIVGTSGVVCRTLLCDCTCSCVPACVIVGQPVKEGENIPF